MSNAATTTDTSSPFLLLDSVDLKLVFRHMSDSVFVSDAEGRILMLNPASQALLGIHIDGKVHTSVQELMGKGVYERSTALEAARRKTMVTDLVKSHNGQAMMAISKPVLDEKGNVVMVITSSRNKKAIDEFLANALQAEKLQADRYRQAASVLSETLQHNKPVAASQAMQSVMTLASSVAPTEATVLLTGESGTGKEVLAHYIHSASGRADELFIPINCAAVPPELMEAEFFGYARGAFTNANPLGKAGLFEMAHHGTLFLDEIGEMPLTMQSKFLRVLETGIVRRLGGTRNHKVDVRIIAASNRDLYEMTRSGLFRIDLYYRLHVIPVVIPPLRDRPEDIREFTARFLADCNRRYNRKTMFTEEALDVLTRHDWPGNVRELRNIVERLVMLSEQQEITARHCANLLYAHAPCAAPAPQYQENLPLREFRRRMEKEYIRATLDRCQGSVRKAAHALGLHKTALYRKLSALGLAP
ncbi:MAG: sigma 54-interacting transcriptional regulator [Deltaproteobacteria bacterium]|jgi:transcriptional regulator with PAS, ATPase and Fis domain|nr:sigma 54-interacting transcriptional regulator [Deltaproteobacteria bacterium]